jgi:hypothetical protein
MLKGIIIASILLIVCSCAIGQTPNQAEDHFRKEVFKLKNSLDLMPVQHFSKMEFKLIDNSTLSLTSKAAEGYRDKEEKRNADSTLLKEESED